jgi:haloalkane dehalogenase
MPVIRTPEERFEGIKDFPYDRKYLEVDGLRVHYVDVGEGEAILCLHGEPTWSYLYRKMIPILSETHRVLAMDFIGFGRSVTRWFRLSRSLIWRASRWWSRTGEV